MLSRVIGGLSEANVQLALCVFALSFRSSHQATHYRKKRSIISDVTTTETRSKTLALIGIAFSICFCIGPPIGAYFASRPLPASWNTWGIELNIYAAPALLTLLLLVAETGFLIFALPETRVKGSTRKTGLPTEKGVKDGKEPTRGSSGPTRKKRIAVLKTLGRLNFCFLTLFSGVEFTFTFLTFDRKLFLLNRDFFFFFAQKPFDKSLRLDKHSEWKTPRFDWRNQRSPPSRLRSKIDDESRRRQHGQTWRIVLHVCVHHARTPPEICPNLNIDCHQTLTDSSCLYRFHKCDGC
jgi:hypothetical protein